MAQFETNRSSMPDASSKLCSLREKICAESSVKSRIAALQGNLSNSLNAINSSHIPKPDFERRLLKTQTPKPVRNQLERDSTDRSVPKKRFPPVFVLGSPPLKPDRPPNVDIHRFRRNSKYLNDGPRMKIPHHVAPSPAPAPLRLQPPPNLEAVLVKQAERFKKHQERNRGKKDINHEVTEEKQTETKGTINSEEIKRQTKKKERKQLTKQETKEQKHKDAMVSKIKGPVHVAEREKALLDCKGAKSAFSLAQGGIVHNTEDYVKTKSVHTDHEEEEQGSMSYKQESEIYDDIGAPADSGLDVKNVGEDDIYDDVDNPEMRDSFMPQQTTDGDEVYYDVYSQSPPLPFGLIFMGT
ncbi:FYN-binding protein 1-like isoform X2 [Trachinotus anak]|uniref:FYN-binding protein 1-like isoform X2 n=1 Tax=Trachinotus anak TaxID=443729 RepID=UPI0039F25947